MNRMLQAVETLHVSKRYGSKLALRDCTLNIPLGSITALVGPNGAGKTTLLNLAVGLLGPSSGSITVLGYSPGKDAKKLLPLIGFVSQTHALYRSFTVSDMLTLGRKLNPQWQQEFALKRLAQLDIPLQQTTEKLSKGQQAQVALILALAKQPKIVILDEPFASLDPLARREFQQILLDTVAERHLTVIVSSHIITDLERFCDHVVILSAAHVQVDSPVEQLLQSHTLLVGPREDAETVAKTHTILSSREAGRQCILLVQTQEEPIRASVWEVRSVSLEDIVLAYLSQPDFLLNHSEKDLEVAQ